MPDDAGMGLAPARAAKTASDRTLNRPGVSGNPVCWLGRPVWVNLPWVSWSFWGDHVSPPTSPRCTVLGGGAPGGYDLT